MRSVKDYIIFPLDFSEYDTTMRYVELLKDVVGVFKIGLELFISQGPGIIGAIRSVCNNKVFLDLKLHDIPETVKKAIIAIEQYKPDFITIHPELPEGLLKEIEIEKTKVLAVTLLTSIDREMVKEMGYAEKYIDDISSLVLLRAIRARQIGCHGVVCSGYEVRRIKKELGSSFITVVPGIRPSWSISKKDDQKRIVTPKDAILSGADYIVVGRPIRDAKDPKDAALKIADEISKVVNI